MKTNFLFILFAILHFHSVIAQNIGGTVLKGKDVPVPYATIRLLKTDSTYVQGTCTDSLGLYSLDVKEKGKYLLYVSSIGYKPKVMPIDIDTSRNISPIMLDADNVELDEVVVKGTPFIRTDDKILIIPEKKLVKYSASGYDMLYRLMIPEISVDRTSGKVTTIGGEATLYIDGRKVGAQEIRNMNPKEIDRIEYYDTPIGKYMNDIAAINFITKRYKNGGYVAFNGEQKIGYDSGEYNMAAKLSRNNTDFSLIAGCSNSDYDGTLNETNEKFVFPGYTIDRYARTLENRLREYTKYAQLNISNQGDKHSLTGKVSLVHNSSPDNYTHSMLEYAGTSDGHDSKSCTDQSGWRPGIELYGYFDLNKKQFFEVTVGANYSHNKYDYSYRESGYSAFVNSKEDLYDFSLVMNYGVQFSHKRSLTVQAYHFHTVSSVDYTNNNVSWQHYWDGESLLFLEYNRKFGEKLSLRLGPGMSYVQYRLHGYGMYGKYSPRLHFNMMYYPSGNQQIRLSCPVGNGGLNISRLNEVEQQIDSLQIRRGNPNQKVAFQTTPMIAYNGQFGNLNIGANVSYNIINNAATDIFYIENGKLIRSNRSDANHRRFLVQLSGAWKATDKLRIKLSGGWQDVRYISTPERLDSFFGNIQADYYWNDFTCGIFASSERRWLDLNLIYGIEPARYGAFLSWNHGNWQMESGVTNPFTKDGKQTTWMDRDVYSYDNVATGKLYWPCGYIKLSYTFSFGKKTARDEEYIDTNINSAILKAK